MDGYDMEEMLKCVLTEDESQESGFPASSVSAMSTPAQGMLCYIIMSYKIVLRILQPRLM